MSIQNQPVTLHFIRLSDCARACGAKSVKAFVADLRALSPHEKREVADLVKREG